MYYSIVSQPDPDFEILSLADAKTQLRVTHAELDDKIQLDVDTAIEKAQDYCGRQFYPATLKANFRHWHKSVEINRGPNVEIVSISFYPAFSHVLETVDSSMYETINKGFESEVVFSDSMSFPALEDRDDAIQIEFTAGFETLADVPKRIIAAVVLYVRDLFTTGNRVDEKISAADNLLLPFRCRR